MEHGVHHIAEMDIIALSADIDNIVSVRCQCRMIGDGMVIVGSRAEDEMFGIRCGSLHASVLPLGAVHLLPRDGGGTRSDVGHTRDDGDRTNERLLFHGDIIQIDESVVVSIVGGSFEDDDHRLSGVAAEVDRIVLGPGGDTGKARSKSGLVGDTTISGDIYGKIAACRILVPEGQLHGRSGRQAERDGFQEIGVAGTVIPRIEDDAV